MVKLFNQISFSDIYQESKDTFQNDKPKFLELLTQHLDLSSLVPPTFYWSYYKAIVEKSLATNKVCPQIQYSQCDRLSGNGSHRRFHHAQLP